MNELILTNYEIEPNIIIDREQFFTLSIENKAFLLKCLKELKFQSDGTREGAFNLLYNDKSVNIEKSISIITDFTDINFNSRSITTLLTKKFSEFLSLGEQANSLINLESIILNLAEDFRIKSGLNIDYDATINSNNLAKICSLKIQDDKQILVEKLCEYLSLLCDLKPLKLIILVFGKHFLDKKNINDFNKYCIDKEVRLLIIEGTDKTERMENERRLIIDKDLCPIPQGYAEEY